MRHVRALALALTSAVCLVAVSACDGDDGATSGSAGGSAHGSAHGSAGGPAASGSDGGAAPGSAEGKEGVQDVVSAFYVALADSDGRSACAMMTGPARRELMEDLLAIGKTCEETAAVAASFFDDEERRAMHSIVVQEAAITGDTAVVQDADIQSTEGHLEEDDNPEPLRLVRRDGRWLLDKLG